MKYLFWVFTFWELFDASFIEFGRIYKPLIWNAVKCIQLIKPENLRCAADEKINQWQSNRMVLNLTIRSERWNKRRDEENGLRVCKESFWICGKSEQKCIGLAHFCGLWTTIGTDSQPYWKYIFYAAYFRSERKYIIWCFISISHSHRSWRIVYFIRLYRKLELHSPQR